MTVMQIVRLALLYFSLSVPCEAAEQVRIAHNNLLPPFAEVKDGKTVGLVVDTFRTAAERAGYGVEFLPVSIEQMELALNDGRARAALPMAITPERRKRLDFSATLLMSGGAFYVRAPEPTPEGPRALAGKTVVTPRTGPLAAFIQKTAPEVKVVVTEDYETSLARLVSGEADAAAVARSICPDKVGRLESAPVCAMSAVGTQGRFWDVRSTSASGG